MHACEARPLDSSKKCACTLKILGGFKVDGIKTVRSFCRKTLVCHIHVFGLKTGGPPANCPDSLDMLTNHVHTPRTHGCLRWSTARRTPLVSVFISIFASSPTHPHLDGWTGLHDGGNRQRSHLRCRSRCAARLWQAPSSCPLPRGASTRRIRSHRLRLREDAPALCPACQRLPRLHHRGARRRRGRCGECSPRWRIPSSKLQAGLS